MGQTSYSNYHSASIAGQVVEGTTGRRQRGRYECSEDLNFGEFVELHTDGKLRRLQGTALGKTIGVIPYNASLPPGGYKAGEFMVPVMRSGQVWVPYTGTAPAVEAKPNLRHASDDTNSEAEHRGKVTATATSAVAGSEISAAPEGVTVIKVDTATSLALVELNLPA